MPRSFVHLLLSVLLLVTQQLALLHATAHAGERWHPAAATAAPAVAQAAAVAALPEMAALPELCALCIDGAQVAFALPPVLQAFLAPAPVHGPPVGPRTAAAAPRDAPAFQPRGPPQTC